MPILWVEFLVVAGLIIFCGSRLTRHGDVIAEKTGLGGTWIGLVLLAVVTSLPELITGISSVTLAGVPDITVGDVMGADVFNITFLAFLDIFRKEPVFSDASRGHLLSAGFSTILIGIAAVSIMLADLIPSFGHIGLYTPVIIIVYLAGIRSVYYYEKDAVKEYGDGVKEKYADVPLKKTAMLFSIYAAVIVAAATYLPYIADKLAFQTGLGQTFVGSVLVAMTTTLPEATVSVAAIKMGAKDMAIANVLGSNMFNIIVLAIDDLLFLHGPIFSFVSRTHTITAVMAILMTAVVIIALSYPKKKKTFLRPGWDSLSIIVLWFLTVYFLYLTRGMG